VLINFTDIGIEKFLDCHNGLEFKDTCCYRGMTSDVAIPKHYVLTLNLSLNCGVVSIMCDVDIAVPPSAVSCR
jgi:hypothetical protein